MSDAWHLCHVRPAAIEGMKGTISLSLADELRAIRGGNKHKTPLREAPEQEEYDAPWQPDLDRMQHTLEEVLQSVGQFSGVELPGVLPTSPDGSDSLPRQDCNTLKDRIRNDLEAFSVRTTAEMSRQAEERARAALGALQNELSGQIEQAAGTLREKLEGQLGTEQMQIQITQRSRERVNELIRLQTDKFARWVWLTCQGTETPTSQQIQKLLEPHVEEATAAFATSLRQNVQDLAAEQERVAQEKLRVLVQSFQGKLRPLEETSLQACRRNADSVAEQSADRLNALADEVVKDLRSRIGAEVEGAVGRFQARLTETSTTAVKELQHDQDQRAENFRQRLGGIVMEAQENRLSEISARLAQTSADLIESSVQHLHHHTEDSMEHSREEISAFMKLQTAEVQQQIHDLGLTANQALDQELADASDRHIANSRAKLDSMVQGTMESMAERIRQAADQQLQEASRAFRDSPDEAVSKYVSRLQEATDRRFNSLMERLQQEADHAAQRMASGAKAASESLVRVLSSKANDSAAALQEKADQVTRRIELSLQESLEAYRQQLDQITRAGLEQQQNVMSGNIAEMQNRMKQAADLLFACSASAR